MPFFKERASIEAFNNLTDQDAYWAAKIVMSFTEKEIRAIVRTAELSDSEAEQYLVNTLLARRDKIGKTWLARLSSFDAFELTPQGELKFEHLASLYDFAVRPEYTLNWFAFDNRTGERQLLEGYKSEEGYFVAVIASAEGTVEVYVRNQAGNARIVGVERR